MPPFDPSPFASVPMALPGRPFWLFGFFADTVSPTRFNITQAAAYGNIATVTGFITSGPIPHQGEHITTTGLTPAGLNVTDACILAVDISPKGGYGTITYELPSWLTLPPTSESGMAIIPRTPEQEVVQENDVSMAVCLPDSPEGHSVQGFSAEVTWPWDAIVGKVDVQVADAFRSSAFHTIHTIEFPCGRYDTPAGVSANFVRLVVCEISGNGRLTGRLLVR